MRPSGITPKDPAMMQIKQLLNSSYKHGIPAIRLMGETLFDVYSPKIMAAIMGLEDMLASRCIAIPMRWTEGMVYAINPLEARDMM